jgi:uncharacterized membrane protein YgcG
MIERNDRNERKSMDAGSPGDPVSEASSAGEHGGTPIVVDPMRQLESELHRAGEVPAGERVEHAQRLLEETWSLFTECLVIRDGLLEACQEIERTMNSLQHRLGATMPTDQTNGNGHSPANGAALPEARVRNTIAVHDSLNGVTLNGSSNGASAHSGSNGGSSNGNSGGAGGHQGSNGASAH